MVFYPNTQIKDPFANEPVPMKIPSSGQVMEDPRIQRNVQAYMDKLNADAARGQAIRDTLAREQYISPTENVRPLNPEIEDRIRDAVFNPKEDTSFNDRVIEAYQRKMLGPSEKSDNKPASKKEQFKAKAKKSVRDWTDDSGMHYIANVNPYAAAGMGFANQMANPFKQKYFESRADANEEEDARRLNYEIARQRRLDDIAEQERKANALRLVESESVNVPFMSDPSSFMSTADNSKYNSAMDILNSTKEYDTSTVEGRREYNKDQQLRKAARATVNQLNLKYKGKGSVIKSSSSEDPLGKTGRGLEGLKARGELPTHQKRNLEFEDAVNKGNVLGRFGTFLNEVTSFGASDRKAKMLSNLQRIHNELAGQGYTGHVISRETLEEEASENPQIAARQNEIAAMLDQRNAILVQMVSRNGHNVITYLVTPEGVQDLNDIKGQSARSVELGTEENAAADVRDDLRY